MSVTRTNYGCVARGLEVFLQILGVAGGKLEHSNREDLTGESDGMAKQMALNVLLR